MSEQDRDLQWSKVERMIERNITDLAALQIIGRLVEHLRLTDDSSLVQVQIYALELEHVKKMQELNRSLNRES